MSDEELIETLKLFEKEKVENLPESARNLFYAIMRIADERDMLIEKLKIIKNIIENSALETYATGDTNTCKKILQEIGEVI